MTADEVAGGRRRDRRRSGVEIAERGGGGGPGVAGQGAMTGSRAGAATRLWGWRL